MPNFIIPNNPLPQIGIPPGIPNLNLGNVISNGGIKRAVNYWADAGGCGHWRMLS